MRGLAVAATAVSLASVGATLACPLLVGVFIDRANGGTRLSTLAGVALGYLGSGFSTERLMEVLRHLGRDIEVVVAPASGPIGELRFRELARCAMKEEEPVSRRRAPRTEGSLGREHDHLCD
ncbi:MAG: hypothetical protein ACYDA5_11610 [Vulcanimicrobiaceae bacterium]